MVCIVAYFRMLCNMVHIVAQFLHGIEKFVARFYACFLLCLACFYASLLALLLALYPWPLGLGWSGL